MYADCLFKLSNLFSWNYSLLCLLNCYAISCVYCPETLPIFWYLFSTMCREPHPWEEPGSSKVLHTTTEVENVSMPNQPPRKTEDDSEDESRRKRRREERKEEKREKREKKHSHEERKQEKREKRHSRDSDDKKRHKKDKERRRHDSDWILTPLEFSHHPLWNY